MAPVDHIQSVSRRCCPDLRAELFVIGVLWVDKPRTIAAWVNSLLNEFLNVSSRVLHLWLDVRRHASNLWSNGPLLNLERAAGIICVIDGLGPAFRVPTLRPLLSSRIKLYLLPLPLASISAAVILVCTANQSLLAAETMSIDFYNGKLRVTTSRYWPTTHNIHHTLLFLTTAWGQLVHATERLLSLSSDTVPVHSFFSTDRYRWLHVADVSSWLRRHYRVQRVTFALVLTTELSVDAMWARRLIREGRVGSALLHAGLLHLLRVSYSCHLYKQDLNLNFSKTPM